VNALAKKAEMWSKGEIIAFYPKEKPSKDVMKLHPPLFIEVETFGNAVKRSLIDNGAALNIVTTYLLSQFDPELLPPREETTMRVKGFYGIPMKCVGIITLPIRVGKKTLKTLFYITDGKPSFNLILGRPWIDDMEGVASTLHRCFKFCFEGNVYKVEVDEQVSRQCNYVLPKRFFPYSSEDEAILAKNEQIYRKALQKIKITKIGFGSYTIVDMNNLSPKEHL